MALSQEDAKAIAAMFSTERLKNLLDLSGNPALAIELHQQTLKLGTSLMTVIATLEISIRNQICDNLAHHFGVSDWLLRPPVPFQWRKEEQQKIGAAQDSARRAEYAKLSQKEKHALDILAYPNGQPAGKSHLQRARDRRKHIAVSEGKVVAELTFYFWKRLYGPEYEQVLWRTTLKRTFPYKKIKRSDVAINLEQIYQSRNRLAHHEPVLHGRFEATMKSIDFIIQHLGASIPAKDTALAKLLANEIASVRSEAAALHDRLDKLRQAKATT